MKNTPKIKFSKSPLEKRIALVTGGSSGIGKAISTRLSGEGAIVYVNYRSHPKIVKKLISEILSTGAKVIAIRGDVSKEIEVKKMFRQIAREQGRLDILVNCAGVENAAPILKMTAKAWDEVMNTNLRGTFLCSQAAAQMMAKRKNGVIINVSSVHEKIPWGKYAHYCASKGGVMLLMKTMALELGHLNIRVNNVAPGSIATPINESWLYNSSLKKIVLEKIPERRIGTPEEVAGAVFYLTTDEARYVTGTSLFIDGGMSLYANFLSQG
jgi:glucose 1-dehydrogenase